MTVVQLPRPAVALRVIGLDPGSVRTGWGIVEFTQNRVVHVGAGVVRVPDKAPLEERLFLIHEGLSAIVREYAPSRAAIEDIFFAKFPQAALVLGHARGVAMLALRQAGLEVAAYPPAVVKRALVGSGRADKQQVAMLVAAMLGLKELPTVDATDALAIAITHVNVARVPARR